MRARAAIRARDLLLRVLWFSHSCASNHIPITAFGFGRAGDFSTIVRFRGRQKVAGIGPFLTPVILAAKRLEPNEQLLPYSGRAAMVRTISVRGGAFNFLFIFGLGMLSHSQSLTSSPMSKWLVAWCLFFLDSPWKEDCRVDLCERPRQKTRSRATSRVFTVRCLVCHECSDSSDALQGVTLSLLHKRPQVALHVGSTSQTSEVHARFGNARALSYTAYSLYNMYCLRHTRPTHLYGKGASAMLSASGLAS